MNTSIPSPTPPEDNNQSAASSKEPAMDTAPQSASPHAPEDVAPAHSPAATNPLSELTETDLDNLVQHVLTHGCCPLNSFGNFGLGGGALDVHMIEMTMDAATSVKYQMKLTKAQAKADAELKAYNTAEDAALAALTPKERRAREREQKKSEKAESAYVKHEQNLVEKSIISALIAANSPYSTEKIFKRIEERWLVRELDSHQNNFRKLKYTLAWLSKNGYIVSVTTFGWRGKKAWRHVRRFECELLDFDAAMNQLA